MTLLNSHSDNFGFQRKCSINVIDETKDKIQLSFGFDKMGKLENWGKPPEEKNQQTQSTFCRWVPNWTSAI